MFKKPPQIFAKHQKGGMIHLLRQTASKKKSISNRFARAEASEYGPRRGKEDAFEKQIAGRWHVITLQEAP